MLDEESRLDLPVVPAHLVGQGVAAWRQPVTIDTYLPDPADRYPAFLENRVYQGSSGRVYPLPFHERISPTKAPHAWDAIHLENPWIRLMILPELGGRIHVGMDTTNGYDFFYRNNVIKPALVGLAGPWLSGGVEFNWPQHHRPATFLPVEATIEHEADGAVTVWCSDHDPFARMKGMHGIRLRPDSSVIELRARLFNRTDEVQTFLWWANVAAAVNDDYQSFFPTDVHAVADHAKRAVTAFPAADRPYYGIDYQARKDDEHPDGDRIDWYRNIPVPTSYMALGTQDDFFGGYDHGRRAGFVHWADHQVAPGKKQWTWGNGAFGKAWDANLTDTDGPYVELMAGVFTDNQPDFTFLAPGETKTFSQYWYPIQETGPVHQANLEAAVRLDVTPGPATTGVRVAVAMTQVRAGVAVRLTGPDGTTLWQVKADSGPDRPIVHELHLDAAWAPEDLTLVVEHDGDEVIAWRPRVAHSPEMPEPAQEPLAPDDVSSVDELYLIGVHLDQYRHATRSPEPYWLEAVRRDEGDYRSNLALAGRRYRAGQYAEAEQHLRVALARQTGLNTNPADGEATFRLGQVLARTGRTDEAYEMWGKARWNHAWRVPALLAMARLDAARGSDRAALDHARAAADADADHLQAHAVLTVVLRNAGRAAEADAVLARSLERDPLDVWTRDLAGLPVAADAPTLLDVALEYDSLGAWRDAVRLLESAVAVEPALGQVEVRPLAHLHAARILEAAGDHVAAERHRGLARTVPAVHCLASRLDDVDMLRAHVGRHPDDARAWAILGHWLYFQRRHHDAIAAWRTSAELDPSDPVVWRNRAVAAFNVLGDADAARDHYERALEVAPGDPRLVYERDQLAKRSGALPEERLAVLAGERSAVDARDDLIVELAQLHTATGGADVALELLLARWFQPWEGGEGQVLSAWDEALLALARRALDTGDGELALQHVRAALEPVASLGEARHPLANTAQLYLMLGDALAATGDGAGATAAWSHAAGSTGDFQSMAPVEFSEMTYYAVVATRRLGDHVRADALVDGLAEHAAALRTTPAKVDYFATSLPTLLLFQDDLQAAQETTALLLEAQVAALRGDLDVAAAGLDDVLTREPSRLRALDLRRELSTLPASEPAQ
jgi:tetratricopeptide (TPR) repeat protein